MGKSVKPRRPAGEQFSRSPSGFNLRLYGPQSIAAFVAELREQGIDASATLEGTHLAEPQLESHTTKISYRQLDRVLRNALRLSSDPAIALRAGRRMHVTAYGMYGYALLSSATLAEARDFATRYIGIVGATCTFSFSHHDAAAALTFQPQYWPPPWEDVHRLAVEFALSAHLTTTRDWAGPQFKFSRVKLDFSAPAHADVYEDIFECPILFEQDTSGYEYVYDAGPLHLADPRAYAMASEMCAQLLEEVAQADGIASAVRRFLIERPSSVPSIDEIAMNLGTYSRGLRRRLTEEGTSYRGLVAEVRMRLAVEYLSKTRMTHEEIASRLGYSDAANFRHAFIRWTGKNPIEFRTARRR